MVRLRLNARWHACVLGAGLRLRTSRWVYTAVARHARRAIQAFEALVGHRTNTGRHLQKLWGIPAVHVLYHRGGNWYRLLERFPGALADPNGFVLFQAEADFQNCAYLEIDQHVHVPSGVSKMPGYKRVRP